MPKEFIQIKGLTELLASIPPNLTQTVAVSTTNRLGRMAFTQVKRAISRGYTIQQKDLNMKYIGPKSWNPRAYIEAKKRPRSLSQFKVRQNQAGVTHEVRRGYKKTIPGAFIAKTKKFNFNYDGRTYTGVFKRRGGKRYPLRSFYGLSEYKLLNSDWIQKVIKTTLADNMEKVFSHEVQFKFGKAFKTQLRGTFR